jgi:hypothetical protein
MTHHPLQFLQCHLIPRLVELEILFLMLLASKPALWRRRKPVAPNAPGEAPRRHGEVECEEILTWREYLRGSGFVGVVVVVIAIIWAVGFGVAD